jgi:hypothetical protein
MKEVQPLTKLRRIPPLTVKAKQDSSRLGQKSRHSHFCLVQKPIFSLDLTQPKRHRKLPSGIKDAAIKVTGIHHCVYIKKKQAVLSNSSQIDAKLSLNSMLTYHFKK